MNKINRSLISKILVIVFAMIMFHFTGSAVNAEQLDAKDLTIAPVWYQPRILSSIDEAAKTLNNFSSFYSDWTGGEIKQLNVDRSGVRLVAVSTWTDTNTQWVPTYGGYFLGSTYVPYSGGYYQTTQTPKSSESRISIPAGDIANIKVVQFPYLDRDYKWGADIRFANGSNITLRAKNRETAQKIADALATLAVANGCKLPSPFGLICQTENTAAEFTRLKWATGKGVLVSAIFPGSPAHQAGLTRDDIITEINGQTVTDPAIFEKMVNQTLDNRAESQLELKVFQNGQTIAKSMVVKNLYYGVSVASGTLQPQATDNAVPQSLGIAARNLTAEETKKAGLGEQTGILITGVDPGSLAEQMGMKPGDYLLEFNGKKVAVVGSLKQLLASGAIIQDLKIWRNGQVMVLNGVNKL